MKRLTFLLLTTIILLFATAIFNTTKAVEVTFRVDMFEQTVPPEGVHLAGSFQAPLPTWEPAGIALTAPVIGAIWEVTITLAEGETIEYKFINGDEWGEDEWVVGPCSPGGGNRIVTIPANDIDLDVVCFGSCSPCFLPPVDITFQVDMTNETVSPDGIHVAGSFQDWDPATTEMLPVGDNVYAVTVSLGATDYITYKYINGNDWGTPGVAQEIVPSDCGVDDGSGGYNRELTVPEINTTLEAVCFGSCVPCAGTNFSDVTFVVDMTNETVPPEGVFVAGSFNGWNATATPLADNGDGTWEYTGNFQEGITIEYKFINGDVWEDVPQVCAPNGNRYLLIPEDNTILGSVCFSKCNDCNPPLYDVTFSVDMSEQIVSPEGIHLAGSFQGWDSTATVMTDMGNNIFEVIVQIGEGDYHEYKFINGNTWAAAEYVPEECSWFGNRWLVGPSANTILDPVCFGSCGVCVNELYTFNLSVFLEGPFDGSTMHTDLHASGNLPYDQPYNTAPWNYDGTETQSLSPEIEAVDWVYIEFRETDGDASTATPDNFLDHQAAILLADGTIVKPDGINSIQYTGHITENIYVIIHHRNHLSVMSATALTGFVGSYSYNFTDALSKAYLDGQKDLTGGYFGMIGGNSDGNGIVDENDKDSYWSVDAGNTGYFESDLNLDGQVNNQDKADIWEENLNLDSKVPN